MAKAKNENRVGTIIPTEVEQGPMKKAVAAPKSKVSAPVQYADVKLRATEGAKYHKPGSEFFATRAVADTLINSNQAEELPNEEKDEE